MKTTFKHSAVALAVLTSIGAVQAQEIYVTKSFGSNANRAVSIYNPNEYYNSSDSAVFTVTQAANTYHYTDQTGLGLNAIELNNDFRTNLAIHLANADALVQYASINVGDAVRRVDANGRVTYVATATYLYDQQGSGNLVPRSYTFVFEPGVASYTVTGLAPNACASICYAADGSSKIVRVDNADGTFSNRIDLPPAGYAFNLDGSLRLLSFTKQHAYRGRVASITASTDAEFEAKKAEFERSVDKQIKRLTKEAVVGAVVINVIADEFINPALKEDGVSVGATVAGGRNDPEAHVGVNKDLGDGVSANVGVGTSSGNLSVGVAKSVEVNENVRVSVGASYSDAGWTVGPSVQFHDGQGNGVGLAGVIPTVTVGGYTVAIAPQLLVPNLVVIGARALYNWVKAEK